MAVPETKRGIPMHRFACIALLAACFTSSAGLAQSSPSATLPTPQEIANKDSLTVGVGAAVLPDYEGSDDYRIIPAGAIRGKLDGISFITRGTYLYVDVVPTSSKFGFNAGPIIGARFDRRHHTDDPVVRLMAKRKTAIEAGGFVGVSFRGLTNPYDTLALRLDVLHDIGSAHKSTVLAPNVDFSTPLSRKTYASLNVGAEFVTNKFADYYFSVGPADSLATGGALPVFDARGGMKNWKTSLLLNQSITGDLLHGFSVFGLGQYSRLVGDFKRSPIVSQRGSASQWIGALGLAYTW
jgi:outer membrane scaffolding protein for murein synthesis (MipA/OmpV family)